MVDFIIFIFHFLFNSLYLLWINFFILIILHLRAFTIKLIFLVLIGFNYLFLLEYYLSYFLIFILLISRYHYSNDFINYCFFLKFIIKCYFGDYLDLMCYLVYYWCFVDFEYLFGVDGNRATWFFSWIGWGCSDDQVLVDWRLTGIRRNSLDSQSSILSPLSPETLCQTVSSSVAPHIPKYTHSPNSSSLAH